MNKISINLKILSMFIICIAIVMLLIDNNQDSKIEMTDKVYKILTLDEWNTSKEMGYVITDLDQNDGFTHLSTATQLTGTLYYYFKSYDSLMLIEFKSDDLGVELIFEEASPKVNRIGKFPHYYSKLNINKASNKWKIIRDSFTLPEEVILEIEN